MKYALIGIVVAIIILIGFFYWMGTEQAPVDAVENATQSSTSGTLPELGGGTNPGSAVPDVNPVSKANPFESAYENPFQ